MKRQTVARAFGFVLLAALLQIVMVAGMATLVNGALDVSTVKAAGSPEKPITEACSGPFIAGEVCGTLNPGVSAKVGYYFAYNAGLSCTGGSQTPLAPELEGQGIQVSDTLTGLVPETQYSYCLVATNSSGETFGNALSFETPPGPPEKPITEACPGPTGPGSRLLCGTLNPGASATVSYYFQIKEGSSCSGGSKLAGSGEVVGKGVPVSTEVDGLAPATLYSYCLVATNSFGETVGNTLSFETPSPPSINGESVTNVSHIGATLNALVNAEGFKTTYHFEIAKSPACLPAPPPATSCPQVEVGSLPQGSVPASFQAQPVSLDLNAIMVSLEPGATYHFRLVATNTAGTTEGVSQDFTTRADTCATKQSLCPPQPSGSEDNGFKSCIAKARSNFWLARNAARHHRGRARTTAMKRANLRKHKAVSRCRTRFPQGS